MAEKYIDVALESSVQEALTELEAASTDINTIESLIGTTSDTGGTSSVGTVMAKLNNIRTQASNASSYASSAKSNTATSSTVSKTGTLSQKNNYIINLLEDSEHGLEAIKNASIGSSSGDFQTLVDALGNEYHLQMNTALDFSSVSVNLPSDYNKNYLTLLDYIEYPGGYRVYFSIIESANSTSCKTMTYDSKKPNNLIISEVHGNATAYDPDTEYAYIVVGNGQATNSTSTISIVDMKTGKLVKSKSFNSDNAGYFWNSYPQNRQRNLSIVMGDYLHLIYRSSLGNKLVRLHKETLDILQESEFNPYLPIANMEYSDGKIIITDTSRYAEFDYETLSLLKVVNLPINAIWYPVVLGKYIAYLSGYNSSTGTDLILLDRETDQISTQLNLLGAATSYYIGFDKVPGSDSWFLYSGGSTAGTHPSNTLMKKIDPSTGEIVESKSVANNYLLYNQCRSDIIISKSGYLVSATCGRIYKIISKMTYSGLSWCSINSFLYEKQRGE